MNRKQQIVRTGYVGIAVNICVAAIKAGVGIASGAVAIVLDAVNNLTDALSSVVTIIGIKLAGRPADDKHPFGYGRMEYFAAVIVAAMIIIAGGTSLVESVKGILEPEEQEYSVVGLSLIALMVVVKLILGLYTYRAGKRLNSDSLVGGGTECMYDSLVSVATLVSAAVLMFCGISIDAWLAAIISCLIIKAGIEMILSPISELLGLRADPRLIASIKQLISRSIPEVRGVFDVVLHNYGPSQNIGALHVEVEESLSAAQLHFITRCIQHLVHSEFDIFVTVGFYAHHAAHTHEAEVEKQLRHHVLSMDGVLGMHGFYLSDSDRVISFDIVYSFRYPNPITLRDAVTSHLRSVGYEDYNIYIGLDRNFSE